MSISAFAQLAENPQIAMLTARAALGLPQPSFGKFNLADGPFSFMDASSYTLAASSAVGNVPARPASGLSHMSQWQAEE